ncbi:MAG: T9SS type A sorting domain-containing protein [Janthinobacterium lividum]
MLNLSGSNFASGSVVSFNGQNVPTTYNSATLLTATVPAALLATPGSFPVVVTNPAAGGSTTSAAVNFVVTAVVSRWVGSTSTSWFEPTNWSTGAVPATTDDVLLDHSFVAASYTVSLDQNTAVSVQSLTVNPGVGDSIFVVVPATNTLSTALTLSNVTAGSTALAIYNKGVVTNASGASSGAGIEVAGTGPTAFIYNGGSYRHSTVRGHATVVENLSAAAGTELGIFDFRPFSTGAGSTSLSLSGRTYGTLILRSRPNQTTITSYTGAGTAVTIQGNLLIGSGVSFAPAINNDLRIAGDVRAQGTFQLKATSPASATSQLLLAGTKSQLLLGTILFDAGIGLAINNPAGVVLSTPISLAGPLTLTSGMLTVAANNPLTLSSAATITGVSSTRFITGPLARQTAAGALTNLLFPVGNGTGYHPVTLNATAQDATTYLVTETEGPAPDYANLPASTSALPQLTRVSRARSYTITPTPAANNFSGTVTLPFGPTDLVNTPNDASLVIGKNSGTGWQNIGNSGVTVTTPAPTDGYASGSITSGTFTSFSSFALASTSADATVNPLPVTLTSFVARRQVAAVRLSWTTAVEQNNARFDVQRSLDGHLFATVATVAGQGTATQAHQYATLDLAPPAGTLYYRLAQVDTDGRPTYSPVVALAATGTAGLYPNPARDWLTVPAAPGTLVRILDLTGRVLHTLALPPSGVLDVAGLPAGTYLLRLEEGTSTLRFTKE